jgi:hypothetical protein
MIEAKKSQVRVMMRSLNFFNLPNPSSHTMALGFTDLLGFTLTEMSTRRTQIMFLGSGAWLACKAVNLTAICEPSV